MKHSSKFAIASLFFAHSAFAVTPMEGWYWGLMGGASYTSSINFTGPSPIPFIIINNQVNPHPTPVIHVGTTTVSNYVIGISNSRFPGFNNLLNGSVNYNVGGDFGGQLGYRICNFRIEGELVGIYSPLSQVTIGGASIKRHVSLFNPVRLNGQTVAGAAFLNGYFDFYDEENDPTWVPYVGLGVGYAAVRNSVTISIPYLFLSPFSFNFKSNESTPVGQAILGISYFFQDDLSVGLDYRYITTKTISSINTRVKTSTLNLNFNYYLDP